MSTLVLNADGLPVSYLPLSTIGWQEAIKYMVLDKARVLAWHDDWIVRSSRWETPVPSVIMLTEYMKIKSAVRFSRANVYLRDEGVCQYCAKHVDKKVSTLDHVHPVSKGGKTTWENTVTACGPCNSHKSDKVGLKPLKKPYKPDYYELVGKRKKEPFQLQHPVWAEYMN
jgi:5-methylcytosine-specific restriction endonuclease McrA